MSDEPVVPDQIIDPRAQLSKIDPIVVEAPKFKPSTAQVRFMEEAINPENRYQTSRVAKAANTDRKDFYKWLKQPGFKEWYIGEWQNAMSAIEVQLDRIGLDNAAKDFRYWEALKQQYGGLKAKGDQVNNIMLHPINITVRKYGDSDEAGVTELI